MQDLPPATAPRVTVVIVGEGSAEDCLATSSSVLAQTEPAIEIVAVVDGWSRLAHAIGAAHAPWVKVVHAGDRLTSTCIARELAALDALPDARAVFSQPSLIDAAGAPVDDPAALRRAAVIARDGRALLLELVERNAMAAAAVLFARHTARATGVLDQDHELARSGELSLWLALALEHPVIVFPDALAEVRSDAQGAAGNERIARVDAMLAMLGRLRSHGWARLRTLASDRPEVACLELARALLRSGCVEVEPYARELAACVRATGAALPRDPVFERLCGLAPDLARSPAWTTGRLDPRGAEAPTREALGPATASLGARLSDLDELLAVHATEQRPAEQALAAARNEASALRAETTRAADLAAALLAKLRIGRRVAALLGRAERKAADAVPASAPAPVEHAHPSTATSVQAAPPPERPEIVAARLELRDILAGHADRRDCVIFAPTLRWAHELFQRPHQLALEHARQGDLVFFAETLWTPQGEVPFRKLGHRLYATEVEIEVLSELESPIVYFLSYNAFHTAPLTRPRTVYELIDELQVFHGDQAEIRRTHDDLLDTADVVVATASGLLDQVRQRRPDAILCPNAVDDAHFRHARIPGSVPADLARLLRPGHHVVGYYGALARWLDYDLLATVALERPDLELVLIGPDYDGSLPHADLLSLPNVHRLESRPYAELPSYLRAFDVAMIPFVVNEITESTSPIKLYEYFSAGKPVVTTALRECRREREPLIALDSIHFVARIDEALTLSADPGYLERSAAIARANTWEARVRTLRAAVEGVARDVPVATAAGPPR